MNNQIEELAADIIETQYVFDAKNYYKFENIAKALIEKGYQKIDKDKVVLTKEEYEKGVIERESMRKQITELFNDREKARKETAEKILNEIYTVLTEKLKQFAERLKEKCEYNRKEYCCEATVSANDIDETLKEFINKGDDN